MKWSANGSIGGPCGSLRSVQPDLCLSFSPSSSTPQDRDSGHSGNSLCTALAQDDLVFWPHQASSRCSVGSLLSPGPSVSMSSLPSCYMVASLYGLAVEAQTPRDGVLTVLSVFPMFQKKEVYLTYSKVYHCTWKSGFSWRNEWKFKCRK